MLRTTIARSLHVQADRHDEVDEAARLTGLDQARAERADQLEDQVVRLCALETVAQELRVEADLERLAVEWHWERLAGFADVGRLRRHFERALGEAHAQRR